MKKLSKIEIIDETVLYYSNNPRAVQIGTNLCEYRTSEGLMCAHSRCLTDTAREIILKDDGNGLTAEMVISNYGDHVHKEQYRGHGSYFWRDIQVIHDVATHWNGKALSGVGQAYVNNLKGKYS